MRPLVLSLWAFAQQIGEKAQIRNQHSPIANLEHPSALSLSIRRAAKLLIRLIVQGCSKLAIGECWLRIFGPSSSGAICCAKRFLGARQKPNPDLLGKAPWGDVIAAFFPVVLEPH